MACTVTIIGLVLSIAGLAGVLEPDPCFYKSTITLLVGIWVNIPAPKPENYKKDIKKEIICKQEHDESAIFEDGRASESESYVIH